MRSHKRIAAAFMAALLYVMAIASSAFAVVYGQAGYETEGYDEDSAWEINSAAVLIKVRDDINSGAINTEKYYRLTKDIDLSGYTDWTPIGPDQDEWNYSKAPFNGVFDGGNHTITLNIARTNQTYNGLFGVVDGGTIKNLKVKGRVRVSNSSTSYAWSGGYNAYVGGIVAYLLGGTVSNCTFDGTITGTNTRYYDIYVGGIAGANRWGKTVITNCKVGGENTSTQVKATAPSTHSYGSGIIGYFLDYNSGNEISYNYARLILEAGNMTNRIYGKRDMTSGKVIGNTEIDPSNPDEPDEPDETIIILTDELPEAYKGDEYWEELEAEGSDSITWTLYSGSLPSGLSLSSSGVISGTPTSEGVFTFTVKATGSSSSSATATYFIQVIDDSVAPTISTSSYLGQFTLSDSLNMYLYAYGTAPITWSVTGSSLPSGLTLSTNGLLYGTLNEAGTFSFTVTASNSKGSDSRTFSLEVLSPYVTIDTTSLPEATEGQSYSTWLYASGYNLPYYDSWAWTVSGLPDGLYYSSSDGNIYGTPTESGTFTVTATATNGSYSDTKSFVLTVSDAPSPPPSITTSSMPDAKLNKSYYLWLAAESDTAVTWSVYGLPSGITATSGGLLYGTPTVSGTYWVSIYAENEGGTDSRTFTLSVLAPTGVEINSENFPDDNFRGYISSNLDSDGDGWLDDSEIAAVANISLYGMNIQSVEGISYFTELTNLTVWNNKLTELDVSGNKKLTYLDCDDNQLVDIYLNENPLLETLYCTNNKLPELDLSGNTALVKLYCSGNRLTNLDLSNNPLLTDAEISSQSVDGLKVSKSAASSYYTADLSVIVAGDDDGYSRIKANNVRSDYETASSFNSEEGTARFYSLPGYVIYDYNTNFPGNDDISELYMSVQVYPNDEPSVVTESLPEATQGSYYDTYLLASSKTYANWTLISGSLPTGLTLDFDGELSGTPTALGYFTFTARASNTYGNDERTYSLTVNAPPVVVYAPSITTTSISSGTVGTYYYEQIYATSTTPLTWSASGLPGGLTINSSGAITGNPTEAGTFYVNVMATNSAGSASITYALTISGAAPSILTSSLTSGRINEPYSASLSATGDSIAWNIVSGALPPGISLGYVDGTLSGTPTAEGSFTVTLSAGNPYGSDSRTFTLTVNGVSPTIITTEITSGKVNEEYSFAFSATGSGTITWGYSGTIPPGLTLSTEGMLSGTPTSSGRYAFSVLAENSSGSSSKSFTLVIDAPSVIAPSITTMSIPPATINTAYSTEFAATGTAPITWSASGDLPAGMTLSEGGIFSGTPTTAGVFTVNIVASNASGMSNASRKSFTFTVNGTPPEITTTSADIPAGTVGAAYSVSFSAKGTAPITWKASTGLPEGLSLTEDGVLSGTPAQSGTFNIAVTASNVSGGVSKTFTLTINAAVPKITTATLPDGMINTAYEAELKAEGTSPTWNYSGKLPEGLSLSSEGRLSGTPRESGSFDITLKAENSSGSDSKKYTLFIDGTLPTIKITGAPTGIVGKEYSALIETSGTAPVTLTLSGGNLPEGLALDGSSSTISGTFAAQGMYTFELTASNIAGSAKQSFTITVYESKKPAITTKKLPDAFNNEYYSFQMEAEGSPVLEWELVEDPKLSGLPGGLELSETGEISGTVDTSKATTFKFKVKVKNSAGDSGVKQFSIKVVGKTPSFKTDSPLKSAKWGSNYSVTFKLANMKATSWSLVGDLPEGMTFDTAKGKISGKPLVVDDFDFTIVASNGAVELVEDFTLVVKGIPPKLKGSFKKGTEGVEYSCVLKATGTYPIDWEFSELPDGLDFTTDETGETCTISGVPQQAFSDKVAVTITNGETDEDSLTKHMALTIKAVTPKFLTKAGAITPGVVGESYSFQFELSAKPVAVDWEYTGNLPDGLTFDDGVVSGVPEESGTFSFKVTAQNASKSSLKKTLSVKITIAPAVSVVPSDNTSVPENETLTDESKPKFVNGVACYERGELTAETLARAANNGEVIVAVLPAIEVEEANTYEFEVELEPSAREGATLVWHSYPDGEDDPDDGENAFFLDGDEITETVPESLTVTVSAWLDPGIIYEPVIAVKISR